MDDSTITSRERSHQQNVTNVTNVFQGPVIAGTVHTGEGDMLGDKRSNDPNTSTNCSNSSSNKNLEPDKIKENQNSQSSKDSTNEKIEEKNVSSSDLKLNFGIFSLTIPNWESRHTSLSIVCTAALTAYGLSVVKECAVAFGPRIVTLHPGSLVVTVISRKDESNQQLIENIASNNLTREIKSFFGTDMTEEVKIELTQVGAVIATEDEFHMLTKNISSTLKKIQAKIENDCKGSLKDFCCTLPMFRNQSRMIIQDVDPKEAIDYWLCMKHNLEFTTSHDEFSRRISEDGEFVHLKHQGFLSKHHNFRRFTQTLQFHPNLQATVIQLIRSLKETDDINIITVYLHNLLQINPEFFPGDCEWVLRNLSKLVKTVMYEKLFEVAKDLIIWIIRLLPNLEKDRLYTWLCFVWNVSLSFMQFVLKVKRSQNTANKLAEDIVNTLNAFANINFEGTFEINDARSIHLCVKQVASNVPDIIPSFVRAIKILLKQPKQTTKPALKLALGLLRQVSLHDYDNMFDNFNVVLVYLLDFTDLAVQFLDLSLFKQMILCVVTVEKLSAQLLSCQSPYNFHRSKFIKLLSYSNQLQQASTNHLWYNPRRKKTIVSLQGILYQLIQRFNCRTESPSVSSKKVCQMMVQTCSTSQTVDKEGSSGLESFYSTAIGFFKISKKSSQSFFSHNQDDFLLYSTNKNIESKKWDCSKDKDKLSLPSKTDSMFIDALRLESSDSDDDIYHKLETDSMQLSDEDDLSKISGANDPILDFDDPNIPSDDTKFSSDDIHPSSVDISPQSSDDDDDNDDERFDKTKRPSFYNSGGTESTIDGIALLDNKKSRTTDENKSCSDDRVVTEAKLIHIAKVESKIKACKSPRKTVHGGDPNKSSSKSTSKTDAKKNEIKTQSDHTLSVQNLFELFLLLKLPSQATVADKHSKETDKKQNDSFFKLVSREFISDLIPSQTAGKENPSVKSITQEKNSPSETKALAEPQKPAFESAEKKTEYLQEFFANDGRDYAHRIEKILEKGPAPFVAILEESAIAKQKNQSRFEKAPLNNRSEDKNVTPCDKKNPKEPTSDLIPSQTSEKENETSFNESKIKTDYILRIQDFVDKLVVDEAVDPSVKSITQEKNAPSETKLLAKPQKPAFESAEEKTEYLQEFFANDGRDYAHRIEKILEKGPAPFVAILEESAIAKQKIQSKFEKAPFDNMSEDKNVTSSDKKNEISLAQNLNKEKSKKK